MKNSCVPIPANAPTRSLSVASGRAERVPFTYIRVASQTSPEGTTGYRQGRGERRKCLKEMCMKSCPKKVRSLRTVCPKASDKLSEGFGLFVRRLRTVCTKCKDRFRTALNHRFCCPPPSPAPSSPCPVTTRSAALTTYAWEAMPSGTHSTNAASTTET